MKNQMNGKGMLVDSSGSRYVGDFVADKKDGYGTFTWPDGW